MSTPGELPQHIEETLAESSHQALWIRIGAGVTALAMIGTATAGKIEYDNPWAYPENAYTFFINQANCPPVPQSAITAVDIALRRPDNPGLDKIVNDNPSGKSFDGQKVSRELEAYYAQEAKEHGLTVIDPTPYLVRAEEQSSSAGVIDVLDSFTENYGFNITVPTKLDTESQNAGVQSLFDLKAIKTKEQVSQFSLNARLFMINLAIQPVELLRFAKIKSFELVGKFKKIHDPVLGKLPAEVEGVTNLVSGKIYISQEVFNQSLAKVDIDAKVDLHEEGHRLDYELCGDNTQAVENDIGFKALNDPDFQYGNQASVLSHPDTIEVYGGTNVLEDKATIYSKILNYVGGIKGYSKVVAAKSRYLLARLEQHFPGIADYYRDRFYKK